jgi:hypothetical protein
MPRAFPVLIIAAALCLGGSMDAWASAGSGEESRVAITVIVPETAKPFPTPTQAPKKELYPSSVEELREPRVEVIKTYELSEGESPSDIPRDPFERGGWRYELADITKSEASSISMRKHSERVSKDAPSNDPAAALGLFEPEIAHRSEDGHAGILSLDPASLAIEAAGTKTSAFTASETREYPMYSSNDPALVPKSITVGGRQLALSSLSWRVETSEPMDPPLPSSYTAVAVYTRTGYRNVVTGYIATVEYKGEISRTDKGKAVYMAHFLGEEIAEAQPEEAQPAPSASNQPEPSKSMPPVEETADDDADSGSEGASAEPEASDSPSEGAAAGGARFGDGDGSGSGGASPQDANAVESQGEQLDNAAASAQPAASSQATKRQPVPLWIIMAAIGGLVALAALILTALRNWPSAKVWISERF